ncbi:type I methionyl aminopeptidase [bacterium]|nr:type I methionyl aminopeptidase [bacterium]MBU1599754.1 type I methionyl aminopeptidase [bacterium]
MIILKSASEIVKIRESERILAKVFEKLKRAIFEGTTTAYLNELAYSEIIKQGALPAFLGYRNFPASICTSINEGVIHGIPGSRKLKKGDLLKIDIGILYKGYHADEAESFEVGKVTAEAKTLINTARKALEIGIKVAKKGNKVRDISSAIQEFVEKAGFSVVRDYCGHGSGKELHEEPEIPNFISNDGKIKIKEGMVFCIEPMINMGGFEVEVLIDGWTVVTKDRSLSAHTEKMVAITGKGTEVLSLR